MRPRRRLDLSGLREAVVSRQKRREPGYVLSDAGDDDFALGESFARRGRPIVENPHSPIEAAARFNAFNAGWQSVARLDTKGR